MHGFGLFLLLRSQKVVNFQKNSSTQTQNRTKVPMSSIWGGIVFLGGLEPHNNLAGQDNTQLPRANGHIAWERNQNHLSTSRMYAQRQREGAKLAWQMVCTTTPSYYHLSPKTWPVWWGHANAPKGNRVMRRMVGRVQMQHRWHRGAVCVVEYLTAACWRGCSVCFFSAAYVLVPGSRRALGSRATQAHRTASPTHTLHIAPRWRRLTTLAWLPRQSISRSSSSTRSPIVVYYFSTRISHRSRWFVRIFQFLATLFEL